MGFESYAIQLLRANRKLKESLRHKYKPFSSTQTTTSYSAPRSLSKSRLERANSRRHRKGLQLVAIIIVIIIPSTLYIINTGEKALSKYSSDYEMKLERIAVANNNKTYRKYLELGYEKLEQKKYKLAKGHFLMALKFAKTGKAATLGYTKCLIHDCFTRNEHCASTMEYYNVLINSNKLTTQEIDALNAMMEGK